MKKIKFILFLSLLLLFSSCWETFFCNYTAMRIPIPATFSPAKELFKIGDTICISSSFGNQVYYDYEDETFTLDNIALMPYFAICKIDESGDDNLLCHTDQFVYLMDSTYSHDLLNLSAGGEYVYENEQYEFQYKFIAKTSGIFLFRMKSGVQILRKTERTAIEGDKRHCKTKAWYPIYSTNENSDNNIDLLLESPDERYHDMHEYSGKFTEVGGYCFRVVE